MLECRLTVVSRLRIAVIVGSHGVLASDLPNCTEQGAAAARAGCGSARPDTSPTATLKAGIGIAPARRNPRSDKVNPPVAPPPAPPPPGLAMPPAPRPPT